MTVRKVAKEDLEGLKTVIKSSGLFPPEYLEEMSSDYFENPETEDIWLTAVEGEKRLAIAYCAPEKFTEGTYNLYAIGVLQESQGQGIGGKVMAYLENYLRNGQGRLLIVETSGSEQFNLTRKFYANLGYNHEATIREFWQEGEDKVIFWKKL